MGVRTNRSKTGKTEKQAFELSLARELAVTNIWRLRAMALALSSCALLVEFLVWVGVPLLPNPVTAVEAQSRYGAVVGIWALFVILAVIPTEWFHIHRLKNGPSLLAGVWMLGLSCWLALGSHQTGAGLFPYYFVIAMLSGVVYLHPAASLVLFAGSHLFFVWWSRLAVIGVPGLDIIGIGGVLVLVSWLVSVALYYMRLRVFARRRVIERQAALVHSVLQSVEEAIIVTDENARIVFWNTQAQLIFGVSALDSGRTLMEVSGLSAGRWKRPEDILRWLEQFPREPQMTASRDFEMASPGSRVFQWFSAPADMGGSGPGMRIHALRDITGIREVERLKGDFVSSVSHELKTPLTSILGFTKVVLRDLEKRVRPLLPAEDEETSRVMRRLIEEVSIIGLEGERLNGLINNLLDVARMEAGKMEWKMAPMHVGEAIRKVVSAQAAALARKGLAVEVEIAPDLPVIFGDTERIGQVIENLLSNAVKFTPEGKVCIEARMLQKNGQATDLGLKTAERFLENNMGGACWVLVTVTDTGMGLSKHQSRMLFQRFHQGGDPLIAKPQGTGLGLAICREIIEYHGGRTWVESEPGQGSRFAFVLPVDTGRVQTPEGLR
ncbi:MAG: sensor histidine kinase [Solirubrobacterales bacterium]